MIDRWLTERTTLAEAEQRYHMLTDSPHWQRFLAQFKESDELWYFQSPPRTWPAKVGAAGVAIVRSGKVAAHFVALRS